MGEIFENLDSYVCIKDYIDSVSIQAGSILFHEGQKYSVKCKPFPDEIDTNNSVAERFYIRYYVIISTRHELGIYFSKRSFEEYFISESDYRDKKLEEILTGVTTV